MCEGDVRDVSLLDEAVFRDEGSTLSDREARFREELARPCALRLVAVLQRDDREVVLGYLLAWLTVDEGHLLNIAVANEARRKGIARELLAAMLAHPRFHAARTIVLEVRASNHPARAFYEGAGFTLSRTRRSYYPDGEDALELVLSRD